MKKQQGMTLIGMIMTMVVVVLCAIVVLRVVPVYLQYFSIIQSIKSLNSTSPSEFSGNVDTDIAALRASLSKRLDMNGVDELKGNQLVITSEGGNVFNVKLNYQVVKPLVSNVSLLFDFQDNEKVKVGSEN